MIGRMYPRLPWLFILAAAGLVLSSRDDGAQENPEAVVSPTIESTAGELPQTTPTLVPPTRTLAAKSTPKLPFSPAPTVTPAPVLQRSLLLKHTSVVIGKHPTVLAFSGINIWVANTFDYSLIKLSPGGKGPGVLAFDGEHIWVTDFIGNSVSKLDQNGLVLDTVVVGQAPGDYGL